MLAKRLQIVLRLIEGKDYLEIQDELKVSSATVSTINNWLKTGAIMLEKSIRRTLASRKEETETKNFSQPRYMSGDLLLPAVDAVGELIKTVVKKKLR